MDPDAQRRKLEADAEARRREWARFSQDIIRVYNPLDQDFRFLYDGYPNTIKAKSYKDMERFKARLYVKKIVNHIIGEMQIAVGTDLIAKRRKRGLDEILDPYQENRQVWDKTPKLNDSQLQKQIISEVVIGLVEEYGKEEPLPEQRVTPRNPLENTQEQIFGDLTKEKIAPETTKPEPAKVVKPLQEIRTDE